MELNQNVQSRLEQITRLPVAVRWAGIVACGALLATAYFLAVYRDTSTRLEKMRAQEFELQRRLSEVRSIAANLHEFEEEIARLELKLSKVLRQLPDNKELEVLLTDISNAGKKSGIEIKSFKRKNEIEHGFYAEVPIAIELEGEFHDVARFFDMLAKLPRIVNMGTLKMKVASENLEKTRLRVEGTATTYRFLGKAKKA
jgi:type IV pilus assembly protein PilO